MTYTPTQKLDKGAFGETITAQLDPFFQHTFPYSTISVSTEILSKTTAGSGSISQADGKLIVKTGTTTGSTAVAETRKFVKYNAGQGITFRIAGFFVSPTAGTTQEMGCGDSANGFFFEYNGTSFGINRRYNSTNNRVAQSSWNLDKCDGTGVMPSITNWTNGIPFQIRFQFLGSGMITWYVENPATGEFVAVHAEEYANTAQVPSVLNPSFPARIAVDNGSTTTDVGIRISSVAAFNEGAIKWTGPIFGTAGGHSVTTSESLLSIRNPSTVDGVTNRGLIKVLFGSLATDGTKNVTFIAYRDATLTGTTSFASISSGKSFAEIDVSSGVTVSGGTAFSAKVVAKSDSVPLDLDKDYFIIYPGETWTFTGQSASSTSALVALTWQENP